MNIIRQNRLSHVYWVANDDGGEPLMVQRPYYHVLDRMYNVFGLVDRAGAFVERYGYNGYGRPLIRESCGRGDFDQDTMLTSIDSDRMDIIFDKVVPLRVSVRNTKTNGRLLTSVAPIENRSFSATLRTSPTELAAFE